MIALKLGLNLNSRYNKRKYNCIEKELYLINDVLFDVYLIK